MNYPLIKQNQEGTILQPKQSYYSDEYAERMCDMYLSEEIVRNTAGKMKTRYRLHTQEPHSIDMALAYDIKCPKCSSQLKLASTAVSYHELGLYACPNCEK